MKEILESCFICGYILKTAQFNTMLYLDQIYQSGKTGQFSIIFDFDNFGMDSYIKHDSKTFFINDVFEMMSIFRVIRKNKMLGIVIEIYISYVNFAWKK